jgi:tetratricopeptide (TPR) repeat protein
MKKPVVIIMAVSVVTITAFGQSNAQEKGAAQAPATTTQGFDEKEFELRWKAETKARRIPDPNKRIAALRRMLTDFPNNPPVLEVEQGILDTYIEFWPRQTERILTQIDKVIGPRRANQKVASANNLHNQLAVKLVKAGILLETAEELAVKGLALFDEQEFYKSQRRLFGTWKEPVPGDEELAKRFRSERAKILSTLGRIYLKEGKGAEAEKIFKEAYESNKIISEANLALAEFALRAGNDADVLEYLSSAAISDPMKPEPRQQLETTYRRTHDGSLDGLEQMLNDKYRILMPNPLRVEAFRPTPARSDRVVLAELFTGSGCIPCVATDLSFEAAMKRYSTTEIAVLVYHLHIPQPDPMTNLSGISRAAFYGINGTPRAVIDAEIYDEGGGPRDRAGDVYRHIEPMIQGQLKAPAQARIALTATGEDFGVTIKAIVDQVQSDSRFLRLQVALVENELQYGGENRVRIHPMVVRSLAGSRGLKGFAVDWKNPLVITYRFDLTKISAELKAYLDNYEVNGKHGRIRFNEKKYAINPENLSVVAFVQDERDKRVLQASYLRVPPSSAPANSTKSLKGSAH